MNNTNKIVLSFPKQEIGETEKMYMHNLENLIEVVQDIDRAGKMIGRPTLLMDFLFNIPLVIGSLNRPEMLSLLGPILQSNAKSNSAGTRVARAGKERTV